MWEVVHRGAAARYKTVTVTDGDQRLLGLETPVSRLCVGGTRVSISGKFLFPKFYFCHHPLFA